MDLDSLTRFAPFSALHGVNAEHTIVCRSDTLNYYLPGITAIKRAFLSGDFPTWAPYEMGGTPLASLPNHAALSPLSLPYFLMPVWLAPAFVKLGEFVVAIGGMFGFLRRLGLGRAASVLAGIIFATSGFMLMWTNWPHTRVAAFIPALFWGLERMVQQRRARDVALVAVVFASMLLGGFPAVTLFALTLAGPYVLVRAFTRFGAEIRAVADVVGRAVAGHPARARARGHPDPAVRPQPRCHRARRPSVGGRAPAPGAVPHHRGAGQRRHLRGRVGARPDQPDRGDRVPGCGCGRPRAVRGLPAAAGRRGARPLPARASSRSPWSSWWWWSGSAARSSPRCSSCRSTRATPSPGRSRSSASSARSSRGSASTGSSGARPRGGRRRGRGRRLVRHRC